MSIDKEIIRAAVKQAVKRQVQESQYVSASTDTGNIVQLINENVSIEDQEDILSRFLNESDTRDIDQILQKAENIKMKVMVKGNDYVFFTADRNKFEANHFQNQQNVDFKRFNSVDELESYMMGLYEDGYKTVKKQKTITNIILRLTSNAGELVGGLGALGILFTGFAVAFKALDVTLMGGSMSAIEVFIDALTPFLMWSAAAFGAGWFTASLSDLKTQFNPTLDQV